MTSDLELATQGLPNCIVIHHIGLPAEKRNAGSRIARGEYLAFFDDDVTIEPLCLVHLKSAIWNNTVMSYGRLWNMEHRNRFDEAGSYLTWTGFLWSRAGQNDIDNGQYSKDEHVLAGKSASCMVRKDVFKQVGGFDEDFGILGEETDLSWRIWLLGKKVIYAPQATGYHAFNSKFKPAAKHYTSSRVHTNGCRNYITMLIKNMETKNLWRILPLHLAIWFFAGCAMIITLKIHQGLNIFRGLIQSMRRLPQSVEKRKIIQSKRVISDKDLFTFILRQPPGRYYTQRFTRYLRIGLHG